MSDNQNTSQFISWPNEGVHYWNAHWRGQAARGFFDADETFADDLDDLYLMADTILGALAWLRGADLACVIDGILLHEAADQWRAETDGAAA